MPQYRFGRDSDNNIVDALLLPADRSLLEDTYLCIGCGQPLIAKVKGEERVKHFAHKPGAECNPETYLHRLAKLTFYTVYQECLDQGRPFEVELTYQQVCSKYAQVTGFRCPVGTVTKAHDLTAYYTGIALEERDGSFIPDLLLFNRERPEIKIYVEVAVTHFLSEKKIRSDERIIEIPINTEEDIEEIQSCRLTEESASFVNFKRETEAVADAACTCRNKMFYCLFVYESGKSYMERGMLDDILVKYRQFKDKLSYIHMVQPKEWESEYFDGGGYLYVRLIREARRRGFHIQNCYVCRYHGDNWRELSNDSIFCKFLKKTCGSNEAVDCQYFRFDESYLER